ncbi:hypothetical protein XENOCAPTIV_016336 [Xenoophorus captivus]|uniref:Uncharacterized protein n=1 Tax=Xenoophorus captivus TaxID=1517983 RepID=A0ABV0RWD4_9TELE
MGCKSLKLEGLFAITLIFSSLHRFSLIFKLGLWLGHSKMLILLPVRKSIFKNESKKAYFKQKFAKSIQHFSLKQFLQFKVPLKQCQRKRWKVEFSPAQRITQFCPSLAGCRALWVRCLKTATTVFPDLEDRKIQHFRNFSTHKKQR